MGIISRSYDFLGGVVDPYAGLKEINRKLASRARLQDAVVAEGDSKSINQLIIDKPQFTIEQRFLMNERNAIGSFLSEEA